MKLHTKKELVKKYHGKFIDVYPHHYEKRDASNHWVTLYEVRGCSSKVKENFQSPEEIGREY
jgi:hypothetical protein